MKVSFSYQIDDLGEVSEVRGETFEVDVKFVVKADSAEDAEIAINELIQEGRLRLIDEGDKDPIIEYDIEDINFTAF